jgi:hypothetical protein
MIVFLFAFFGLADRAELMFVNIDTISDWVVYNIPWIDPTPDPDGLLVEPVCPGCTWPTHLNLKSGFALLFLSGIPAITVIYFFNGKSLTKRISAGIGSFTLALIALLWLEVGILIDGKWISVYNLRTIGLLVLYWGIACFSGIFSTSLIPDEIQESKSEGTIERYISSQWKLAQGFLSVGLAGALGVVVPFGATITDRFGILSIIFVGVSLTLPFLVVPVFLYYRIHRVEGLKRGI